MNKQLGLPDVRQQLKDEQWRSSKGAYRVYAEGPTRSRGGHEIRFVVVAKGSAPFIELARPNARYARGKPQQEKAFKHPTNTAFSLVEGRASATLRWPDLHGRVETIELRRPRWFRLRRMFA